MENWKTLKNIGLDVSSVGRVRTSDITKKLLKPCPTKKLYIYVYYRGKNYLVHRLVATAFVPNPENKKTVHHKNFVTYDNNACNLEWVSHAENASYNTIYHRARKINPIVKDDIANMITYMPKYEIAEKLGVCPKTLYTFLREYKMDKKTILTQYLKEQIKNFSSP